MTPNLWPPLINSQAAKLRSTAKTTERLLSKCLVGAVLVYLAGNGRDANPAGLAVDEAASAFVAGIVCRVRV